MSGCWLTDLQDGKIRVYALVLRGKGGASSEQAKRCAPVDDCRVLERYFLGAALACAMAEPARALWAEDDVVKPVRTLATGGRVDWLPDAIAAAYHANIQIIDSNSIRVHPQAATLKKRELYT